MSIVRELEDSLKGVTFFETQIPNIFCQYLAFMGGIKDSWDRTSEQVLASYRSYHDHYRADATHYLRELPLREKEAKAVFFNLLLISLQHITERGRVLNSTWDGEYVSNHDSRHIFGENSVYKRLSMVLGSLTSTQMLSWGGGFFSFRTTHPFYLSDESINAARNLFTSDGVMDSRSQRIDEYFDYYFGSRYFQYSEKELRNEVHPGVLVGLARFLREQGYNITFQDKNEYVLSKKMRNRVIDAASKWRNTVTDLELKGTEWSQSVSLILDCLTLKRSSYQMGIHDIEFYDDPMDFDILEANRGSCLRPNSDYSGKSMPTVAMFNKYPEKIITKEEGFSVTGFYTARLKVGNIQNDRLASGRFFAVTWKEDATGGEGVSLFNLYAKNLTLGSLAQQLQKAYSNLCAFGTFLFIDENKKHGSEVFYVNNLKAVHLSKEATSYPYELDITNLADTIRCSGCGKIPQWQYREGTNNYLTRIHSHNFPVCDKCVNDVFFDIMTQEYAFAPKDSRYQFYDTEGNLIGEMRKPKNSRRPKGEYILDGVRYIHFNTKDIRSLFPRTLRSMESTSRISRWIYIESPEKKYDRDDWMLVEGPAIFNHSHSLIVVDPRCKFQFPLTHLRQRSRFGPKTGPITQNCKTTIYLSVGGGTIFPSIGSVLKGEYKTKHLDERISKILTGMGRVFMRLDSASGTRFTGFGLSTYEVPIVLELILSGEGFHSGGDRYAIIQEDYKVPEYSRLSALVEIKRFFEMLITEPLIKSGNRELCPAWLVEKMFDDVTEEELEEGVYQYKQIVGFDSNDMPYTIRELADMLPDEVQVFIRYIDSIIEEIEDDI